MRVIIRSRTHAVCHLEIKTRSSESKTFVHVIVRSFVRIVARPSIDRSIDRSFGPSIDRAICPTDQHSFRPSPVRARRARDDGRDRARSIARHRAPPSPRAMDAPRTVDDVFANFNARRAGLIKALTNGTSRARLDVDERYRARARDRDRGLTRIAHVFALRRRTVLRVVRPG